MTSEQKAFIESIAVYVRRYASTYGIKVHSPIIAQAILESAWGKSKLAARHHNYFGLKCGSKWTGPSVNMTTQEEYTPGTKTTIKDNFRVYDSREDGVKGYFEFIQLERYQNLRGITDPQKYLETIKADGYATASDYAEDVMKVVTKYGLTAYDPPKWATVDEAIRALIATEKAEEGYLEKKSKSNLDDKTANAGTANYTKYWRDINDWKYFSYSPGWAGGEAWYWCAAFQFWSFVQTFGHEAAKKLLLHAPFISCATLASKSKSVKQLHTVPQVGDECLFWKKTKYGHVGLVYKVDRDKKLFYTIEGNTGTGSGVIANGGGVVVGKKYSYDNTAHRFHRPDYAAVLGLSDKEPTTVVSVHTAADNIAAGQRWLNKNYKVQLMKYCRAILKITASYDTATRKACVCVWKDLSNRRYGTKLDPGNSSFLAKSKEAAKNCTVHADSAGTFTYIAQIILSAKGYYTGAMDGACGAVMVKAITKYQRDHGLTADGVIGKATWYSLFN